ncbi:MAG: DUF2924 domain-containing protein [Beijerinckiaceae bacterium]
MRTAKKGAQPAQAPAVLDLAAELDRIAGLTIDELRSLWRQRQGSEPPAAFSKDLLARVLAYSVQEQAVGELSKAARKCLAQPGASVEPPRRLKKGSVIVREYDGLRHEVFVVADGFSWQGKLYPSLSAIAKEITGTRWNGPRFFGLRGRETAPAARDTGGAS